MFNHQANRVLVRRGARLLTAEEAEKIAGGSGTGTGCTITGGIHGTATDSYCEDCPDC